MLRSYDPRSLLQLLDDYSIKQVLPDSEKCFILHSGNHTRTKYHLNRLFQYVFLRARLAEAFEMMLAESSLARCLTVLIGPESVGPFLAELQHYRIFKQTRIALAKKDATSAFVLEDSLDLRPQDYCLIVDDVLTTGKTLCGLRGAVLHRKYEKQASGHPAIVGSAVILNRTPEHFVLPHRVSEPCVSLLHNREHPVYAPEECPFCFHQSA